MRVLEFAMKVEEDARRLYEELEARTENKELKQIFRLLAQSEESHFHEMEAMESGLKNARIEGTDLDEAKSAFRNLLQRENLEHALDSDPDGYRHVIKAEEESIKTYQNLALASDAPEAKELLLRIIEQEKRHLEIMTNIYDFVEAPRTYLEWQEFSNLGRL